MALVALYNWSGCHIGGAFSNATATNQLGISGSHDSFGFVGGRQMGCDYQFIPGWGAGSRGSGRVEQPESSTAGRLVMGVTLPSQYAAKKRQFLRTKVPLVVHNPAALVYLPAS